LGTDEPPNECHSGYSDHQSLCHLSPSDVLGFGHPTDQVQRRQISLGDDATKHVLILQRERQDSIVHRLLGLLGSGNSIPTTPS
jgi:hypothetical protein